MRKLLHILIKTIQVLLLAILTLLLISSVYTFVRKTFYHDDMPKVFGFAKAIVVSGSMEPNISVDDIVVVKEEGDYFVKDIIMFYDPATGDYVTHRIVEKEGDIFRTWGDNNDSMDVNPVSKENIVGKVVLIVPFVGKVMGFVQQPIGFVVIIAIGVAIIFVPDLCFNRGKKGNEKEENNDSKEE